MDEDQALQSMGGILFERAPGDMVTVSVLQH